MVEPISVMISSTVNDLVEERKAAEAAFDDFPFIKQLGVKPINIGALASSSNLATRSLAKECDIFILILGHKFGWPTATGKSATEVEYLEAFRDDPTKILIFEKKATQDEVTESDQVRFRKIVGDYSKGNWISPFSTAKQLKSLIQISFLNWLKQRVSVGKNLSFIDHFVRLAIQLKPIQTSEVYYHTYPDRVEIHFVIFRIDYEVHFNIEEISKDFWGCLATLHESFEKWLSYGDNKY